MRKPIEMPTNPMQQPNWWVRMAESIPMEFLECVLRKAVNDDIITNDIAAHIRHMAIDAITEGY